MNAKLADVGIAVVVPNSTQPSAAATAGGQHATGHQATPSTLSSNQHRGLSTVTHHPQGRCSLPLTAASAGGRHAAASASAASRVLALSSPHRGPGLVMKGVDVEGTDDYLDPLYAQLGQLSPASDVYALGLVMCQMIVCCEDPKVRKESLMG